MPSIAVTALHRWAWGLRWWSASRVRTAGAPGPKIARMAAPAYTSRSPRHERSVRRALPRSPRVFESRSQRPRAASGARSLPEAERILGAHAGHSELDATLVRLRAGGRSPRARCGRLRSLHRAQLAHSDAARFVSRPVRCAHLAALSAAENRDPSHSTQWRRPRAQRPRERGDPPRRIRGARCELGCVGVSRARRARLARGVLAAAHGVTSQHSLPRFWSWAARRAARSPPPADGHGALRARQPAARGPRALRTARFSRPRIEFPCARILARTRAAPTLAGAGHPGLVARAIGRVLPE